MFDRRRDMFDRRERRIVHRLPAKWRTIYQRKSLKTLRLTRLLTIEELFVLPLRGASNYHDPCRRQLFFQFRRLISKFSYAFDNRGASYCVRISPEEGFRCLVINFVEASLIKVS